MRCPCGLGEAWSLGRVKCLARLLGSREVPAWATVLITLGAFVIAVLGTLAAARMQLQNSSREREIA